MKEKLETPTRNEPNLYDVAPHTLDEVLGDYIRPRFRVQQIADWLQRGVDSFDAMSNLPRDLRTRLEENFQLSLPQVVQRTEPAADASQKYLFTLTDGSLIEAVYMPMRDRTTFCLSSQAGCAVGCTFCVTGFFGGGRNLTPAEMIGQYFVLRNEKSVPAESINVVFMGMGEPLLNLENVVPSLEMLERDMSHRRITLSTSGIIPGIDELARLEKRPNLAVSINAPDRERREAIMPVTRKYPLQELMESMRRYPLERGRWLTAEYVLLESFNDSPGDAAMLARLLRGMHVKVNAIPFNPDPNLPSWMKRPSDARIDAFVQELVRQGAVVTVRRSKGDQIAAGCGQLRGRSERKRARVASQK